MTSLQLNHDISSEDAEHNAKNKVQTQRALIFATVGGDYLKVEQLLKSGVSVDAIEYNKVLLNSSKNYFTPLQLATLHGYEKSVQLFINYGADVNAKDLFGVTALHLAVSHGYYSILKLLLHAKADYSAAIKFPFPISAPVKSTDSFCREIPHLGGTTPLHLAAATNNVDCVKELIRYGADFNAVDEQGRTSLYIAAQHGDSECVLIHLKEAVGHDILSLPSIKTSDTPLHFAVRYQMIRCVKELINLGSDVNHRNFDGLSPLHVALLPLNAIASHMMTVLKLLVLEGFKTDINLPDWEDFTPLHFVCFNGHHDMWCRRPEMAKFLMAYGANVNIKDNHNCSLLEHELKYPEENFDILKYVVKSLLYLPRLRSLNVTYTPEVQVEPPRPPPPVQFNNAEWFPVFPGSRRRIDPGYFRETDLSQMDEMISLLPEGYPRRIVEAVALNKPPHRSFLRGVPIDVDSSDSENDNDSNENKNEIEHDASVLISLVLRKQLWYEQIASTPRSLQHHCRYLIRSILGPFKLKDIKKLPVPPILHSYLLFELEK